jgi:hypothetical protein
VEIDKLGVLANPIVDTADRFQALPGV